MERRLSPRAQLIVVFLVGLLVGASGVVVTSAATQRPDFVGCYDSSGIVRLVASSSRCPAGMFGSINWNVQGPAGERGPAGPAGSRGPSGQKDRRDLPGPQGPEGPPGEALPGSGAGPGSLESLADADCELFDGRTGSTQVSVAADGTISLRCLTPEQWCAANAPSFAPQAVISCDGATRTVNLTCGCETNIGQPAADLVLLGERTYAIPALCDASPSIACPGGRRSIPLRRSP